MKMLGGLEEQGEAMLTLRSDTALQPGSPSGPSFTGQHLKMMHLLYK